MAEVAVGEGVRGGLEPDDDGVKLGQGADEGVVDVEVDDQGGDSQSEGNVESVKPGDDLPRGVEEFTLVLCRAGGAILASVPRTTGLLGGTKLDEIGSEKVAGDEKIEAQPEQDVFLAKVVASNAD